MNNWETIKKLDQTSTNSSLFSPYVTDYHCRYTSTHNIDAGSTDPGNHSNNKQIHIT